MPESNPSWDWPSFTNSDFDFSRIVTDAGYAGLIDAGLYVAIASWLRWGRSRFPAVLLLLLALISLGEKTVVMLERGNIHIWLMSLIVFWAACKAVEATFKLPGFGSAVVTRSEPSITRSEPDIPSAPLHRSGPGEPAFLASITRCERADTPQHPPHVGLQYVWGVLGVLVLVGLMAMMANWGTTSMQALPSRGETKPLPTPPRDGSPQRLPSFEETLPSMDELKPWVETKPLPPPPRGGSPRRLLMD